MKLTKEERDVMEHVVTDPDGWLDHVVTYSTEKVAEEQKKLDLLNALIAEGKEIDPRQKEALERSLTVSAEERARKMLDAKVTRWKPEYEEKKDKPGYKNRVARDAEEAERQKPIIEAMQKEILIRAEIDRLFRGQAIANLKAQGKL